MNDRKLCLELKNISKSFPGVQALDEVSFCLFEEEIHGLVGENGAGKSTLVQVLGGIYSAEEGSIILRDDKIDINNPHEAAEYGIGIVFQELSLVENMSIAENIFVNRQPTNKLGFIDNNKLIKETNNLLDMFDLNFQPEQKVKNLGPGDKQLIEILKAISKDPEILILDEPTSSISQEEVERLFDLINKLNSQGITVIFISHSLEEVFEMCDRVTVLRNGKYIGTRNIEDTSKEELVQMMVGRKLENFYGESQKSIGEKYFEIKKLSNNRFKDISFSLKKGEILGIFGLVGAGRTEMAEAIFGIRDSTGEVYLAQKKLSIKKPMDAMKNGISYLTEDRHKKGLFERMSVKDNIVSTNLDDFKSGPLGIMQDKSIKEHSKNTVEKYQIDTPDIWKKIRYLSGGNQQRVLISKWLNISPEVLIIDEPTKGVDIGAKKDIYNYIYDIAEKNVGVILISSELPEVLNLSDRIMVMKEGRITGIINSEEANKEKILSLAAIENGAGGNETHEKY